MDILAVFDKYREEAEMEILMQMAGYLVSVLAAGAIVVGIEALNERCPYGRIDSGRRLPAPIPVRPVVLRRTRS